MIRFLLYYLDIVKAEGELSVLHVGTSFIILHKYLGRTQHCMSSARWCVKYLPYVHVHVRTSYTS